MTVEGSAVTEQLPQRVPEMVSQLPHAIGGLNVGGKLAGLAEPDREQRALGMRSTL